MNILRQNVALLSLGIQFLWLFVIFYTDKTIAQNVLKSEQISQIPPRVIPPRPTAPPLPIPQPLPEVPLETPSPSPPITPELPQIPGNITVSQFIFEGNTAFSNEELTAVTAPFINRPITFAELLQAEAAITKSYTNAGYINSGAIIPANQTLNQNAAIVKIQIIEGGLEDIQVTVDGRLKSEYIRSRLALATTKPLNQNRLLEALQLLQLNPLVENISAELSTGSRPELSLLTVRVKEADTFNMELVADNGRNPSVGSFQRGLRIIEDNVLGYGDGFFLEYINTNGSNNLDLRYSIPINPRNGTVILAGGINYSRVIEDPFDELDITGNSAYFELTIRQPVIQTPKHEFALGVTASHQESNNEILGINYPLSPGADENGQTRISALRFFQEWLQRSPQDVLAVRSQFNVGLGIGSTVNAHSPDSLFFNWRGQGQYVRLLAPDTLFVIRSDLQLADRALVPLEQFAVGGLYSVRGYRQDLLLTDNGFFTTAEVRLPILRVASIKGVLQVVPFVDFGVGWNNGNNPIPTPSPNTLIGVGLGLQWQMSDRLTARFDWGIPLTKVNQSNDSLQEQGLYFSLNLSLF
ncbi:ShlB/FhaC/HecB family hemolysin secretion/activation protein [Chroococcus sp. FPU101]|uniref:ShlB/FhaC/HecB family hemolysin secretion/activation protein n=1 Tax=Chroococcus sp. FPU101 TaxID=1974212 RepID=UPI001AAB76CC|nr:ShlB/FhaC/HecB family hemolysin secretion/activation protein [Chroococcus sp. FPU101]GFE71489.1 surface antigen (D15) [Chroococcus sp. FPU101]